MNEGEDDDDLELSSVSFFVPGLLESPTKSSLDATPVRRHVRKVRESTVILSFEKLRHCLELVSSSPSLYNNNRDDVAPWTVPSDSVSTKEEVRRDRAITQVQQLWRERRVNKRKQTRDATALKLQRWFRCATENRILRMEVRNTQCGRWTLRQANNLWGLVLGHRVRVLVRSERVAKLKKAVTETHAVLAEVLRDPIDPNRAPASVVTILDLAVLIRSLKSTEHKQTVLRRVGLSIRDQDLAVGLFRELQLARSRFQQSVFLGCRWRALPPPGYLDLTKALKLNVYSESRVRPSVTSTPPRLFTAAAKCSPGSGSAGLLKESSTPPCLPSKGARREGPRAHIQLDVMGADKLSPASMRRGAQEGELEADRKPGLRISLLLPPAPSSSSSSSSSSPATTFVGPLVVVKRLSRDFGDKTLNPRFDTTFVVPLPVPLALYGSKSSLKSDFRPLMEWWASGVLKIEVLDGERFNRENFLGEVDLLLSQFLLAPVMEGTFPLAKQSVGDRVSGTITVAAYLHLPETPATASPPPTLSVLSEERFYESAVEPPVKMIAQSVRASRQRIPRKVTSPITIPPLPPAPAPLPEPRPISNADQVRRKQISECLVGLDALTGSTDELLLLASKLTRGGKQKTSP